MGLKHLFLFLSIIVLFIVFYRQFYSFHRENLDAMPESAGSENTVPICDNDYSDSTNLPLKEYCVKSSFNSAYDGNDVSKDALIQRIKEGYRFIDLNVFSASGDVYVGFSPDNSPALISNKLLLSDALTTIAATAFETSTVFDGCMNNVATYPVFVHLRIYRPPGSIVDIVSNIANTLNGAPAGPGQLPASPPAYSINYLRNEDGAPTQIDSCTPLSTLMGKMVFSMDILNILEIYAPATYQNAVTVPPDTITAMNTFANVLTGGSTFPAFYRYTDESLIYRTNTLGVGDSSIGGSKKTNVKYMYIAFPHPDDVSKSATPSRPNATGVVQPDVKGMILNRSIQFTPLRVYLADTNLNTYIKIFDNAKTPVVPMSYLITHLQNL